MTNHHQMHPKEFLVGAVIGSLLGGVSALLMAPSSGSKIRQNIKDAYCDLNHRTHDCLDSFERKKRCLSKLFSSDDSSDWIDCAKDAYEKVSKGFKSITGREEVDNGYKDFVIGGIIGGVLGATAGLLLAPKSGENIRHDLSEAYHDISDRTHDFAHDINKKGHAFARQASKRTNKWMNLAKHIMEDFGDHVHDTADEVSERVSDFKDHRLNDVLDWVSFGYKLWRKLGK